MTKQIFLTLLLLLGSVSCSRITDLPAVSPVLRVGVSDEPDSLNPLFSHTAIADDVAALTLAPLFRYDDRGVLTPELTVRVPTLANGDISRDGRRLILHLRHRLRWSDGAPETVRDLRFTWHAVLNPANNTKLRGGWTNIQSIAAPDPYTAVVRLRKPDATILTLFADGCDGAYPPLPAHLFTASQSLNHVAFNAQPISSGPWILSTWRHGSSLQFKPNPYYWRGAPALAGITFRVLPQADTLLTALQSHEIDFVDTVPEDHLTYLRGLHGITVRRHVVATYRHLDFNLRDPALRDARVRRAIIEGVQWRKLLHTVYHDAGILAVSDIFPGGFAAPHLPRYRYDPKQAARLLDESGWHAERGAIRSRDGRPLALTIVSTNAKAVSAEAELQIAAQLRSLGIELHAKNMPASYLFAQNGPLYTGTYQLAWAADTRGPDPDNAANWVTAAQPPNGGNTVFLSDPTIDKLARRARETFDPKERRLLYQREEERLHRLAASYTFSWQRATMAFTEHLHGVRPAIYYSNFWNSWQWRLR
jgi:peptide/nickel transport system substrate-binding protein